MPVISIGVPVYNEAAHLREALDSLLGQDFADVEVLISDNCSTDGTSDICSEYASTDRRVRYHRQDRLIGAGENFNSVVARATGDYFMWAAGHDLRHRAFLAKAHQVLRDDPAAVLCYSRTRWIGPNAEFLREQSDGIGTDELGTVSRFNTVIWRTVKCSPIYGLIRLPTLRRTHVFPKSFGGDLVLLAELACYGKFVELPDAMFMRRINRPDETAEQQVARQFHATVLRDGPRRPQLPYWEMAVSFHRMVLQADLAIPTKLLLLASLGLCLPTRFGRRMLAELPVLSWAMRPGVDGGESPPKDDRRRGAGQRAA